MTGRDLVTDDDIHLALEPYRQVRASERLRAAATQPPDRAPAPAWARRRARVAAAGAAAAVAAAVLLAVAVVATGGSGPGRDAGPGAGRLDLSRAQTVMFADGTTVPVDELFDPDDHQRLQALFAEHGAELVVVERPVAAAADGRVFSVAVAAGRYDVTRPDRIRLDPGVRVEVEVGRGDAAAGTAGLTLYEVFPEIETAAGRDDPVATGRALEELGFQVRWVHIEAAGRGHDVEEPPAGTVVVSVLGPEGQWTDIDPDTDTLMVEVASPEVARDLGH